MVNRVECAREIDESTYSIQFIVPNVSFKYIEKRQREPICS